MAAKKPTQAVGSVWELGDGEHVVIRPDGVEVTVTDGLYVLSQPGTYRSGDFEVEVK